MVELDRFCVWSPVESSYIWGRKSHVYIQETTFPLRAVAAVVPPPLLLMWCSFSAFGILLTCIIRALKNVSSYGLEPWYFFLWGGISLCVCVEKRAPIRLMSPPLPRSHLSPSHTIRSITVIIGFGGLHYCCCLSWLGWYPCPHRSSRLTRWPRDSYAIQQRPPLKSKGSHLVQGCYGLPLHVPLNFILGRLNPQTNRSEPWGHGGSTVALNKSFLFFFQPGVIFMAILDG